ncbi:hypothetical protein [Serratia rhizosphaerae]|nr:hypothetical protein [Serratia rhizosphaerae]
MPLIEEAMHLSRVGDGYRFYLTIYMAEFIFYSQPYQALTGKQ